MTAKEYNARVGENIRKIREASGLCPYQLDAALHRPRGYICKLESGKKRLSDKALIELSVLYDVSVYKILKVT